MSELSDILMEVDVKVISNSDCDKSSGYIDGDYDTYRDHITSNMLCAQDFGNREDACQGDVSFYKDLNISVFLGASPHS